MNRLLSRAVLTILVTATLGLSFATIAEAAATDTSDGCPVSFVKAGTGNATCVSTTAPDAGGNCPAGSSYVANSTGTGGTCVHRDPPKTAPPSSCSIWYGSFTFESCIWKPLMSWLGSWFLTMGAAFLVLAGWMFDWVIQQIIISFGQTIRDLSILDAITIGWTVIRDLSNIFIIGFFAFIAISIILGLAEFGQKRLIANVLVVAVLMNFSLLFTKLIIDFFNFAAYHVYAQMASANGSTSGTFNVSEGFMKPMKITSVWYTYDLVRDVATQTDSGVQAFAFGFVGGIMLLTVAAVLFYGSFLIAWRGIIFIILMLTAPLAFATYLVPTLAKGEYGWDSWWKSLINNAAFGPLLMIMLLLSLSIIKAAGAKATTPIGNIIADPSQAPAGAWVTILVYVIGTGLLFVSLKLASSFAGSIGSGYGLAGGAASFLGRLPFATALGGLSLAGASALRGTRGRGAATRARDAETEISRLNSIASNTTLAKAQRDAAKAQMEKLMKTKSKLEKTAAREFNFLDTKIGSAIGKPLGLEAEKSKGGYAGRSKETSQEAVKAAADATLSKNDARKAAQETVEKQMKPVREAVESQKKAGEALVESARSLAEAEKAQAGHTKSIDEHMRENRDAMQQKVVIEQQFKEGKVGSADRERMLREQEDRITKANQRIQEIRDIEKKHLDVPHVKEAERTIAAAERRLGELNKQGEAAVNKLSSEIIERSAENAGQAIASIKHADAYTTESIVKGLRKKNNNKRLVDQFKAVQEEADDNAAPPAAGGATA